MRTTLRPFLSGVIATALLSGVAFTMADPAQAATTGALSGTVKNATGVGVSTTCVHVHMGSSFYSGSTAASGKYTIAGIPSGTYQVQFTTCKTKGYAPQYYTGVTGGTPTYTKAVSVRINAGTTTTSINATVVVGGVISGMIKNATGVTLTTVCVTEYPLTTFPARTKLIATGTFTFKGLNTSTYTILLRTCKTAGYATQYYNGHVGGATTSSGALKVRVTAGKTVATLNVTMLMGATITGTVTNTTGVPLQSVSIFGDFGSTFASTKSKATGSFTLNGLPTTTVLVFFTTAAGGGYKRQYYNGKLGGAPTSTGAVSVSVTAGTVTPSINAVMLKSTATLIAPGVPAVSAGSLVFSSGVPGSVTVSSTGKPSPTMSVTNVGTLPTGLSVTSGKGKLNIAGSSTTVGTHSVTVKATNGVGAAATGTFVIRVGIPPAITSAATTTFSTGTNGSFHVTATGSPAPAFSETGALPSGITLSGGPGLLSGTPAAGTGGTYPITIRATNGVGAASAQPFTLTVDQAPSITSASTTTFATGASGTFTVSTNGFPAPTLSVTGVLPPGVTFTSATGVLSGTPAAGSGGAYPISFGATNGVGAPSTQAFTLTVDQPSSITSAATTTFSTGTNGSFQVTAGGFPASTYSETGVLPLGVTFTSATGVLSGTPAAGSGGAYPITIGATNGVGAPSTQAFTLTVHQASSMTSASTTTFVTGSNGSFQVTASGFPAPMYTETGFLPPGVTFSNATGLLSGTPTVGADGRFLISFRATNGVGAASFQGFTLTVNQGPAITSASTATFPVGTKGSFPVTTSGFPAPALAETGSLPSGITFTSATGLLSGTPTPGTGGNYPITIHATNGVGLAVVQTFTLTIDQAPLITGPSKATFVAGTSGSVSIAANGFPAPTFSMTGNLPSGIIFSKSTDLLSGIPAPGSGGIYPLKFTATDGVGAAATLSFTLTVDQVPSITSAASTTFSTTTFGTFQVTTNGFPVPSVTIAGALPAGVSMSAIGVLSGTPAAGTAGTYPFVINVTSSAGVSSEPFVLTVRAIGRAGMGYWPVAADGGMFSFGGARFHGSMGGRPLVSPIVSMASTPDAKGYWLVAADGGMFSFGDAKFRGSMGGKPLASLIVGMASTADGKGYWLVAADGGMFSFGDAKFRGSMGGKPLASPIVGMASTADGRGYWLVAADGGMFSFGDAKFHGSMGGKPLHSPIVGMASTPDGLGYWLVAADGGMFSFGDAKFHGSMGGKPLHSPIVGMASTPDGLGYWLVAADGGMFSFGDALFYGSMGGRPLDSPIVGMAGA